MTQALTFRNNGRDVHIIWQAWPQVKRGNRVVCRGKRNEEWYVLQWALHGVFFPHGLCDSERSCAPKPQMLQTLAVTQFHANFRNVLFVTTPNGSARFYLCMFCPSPIPTAVARLNATGEHEAFQRVTFRVLVGRRVKNSIG